MTVADLQRRFYPDAVERDPVRVMLSRVAGAVRPDSVVLDVGAGAGAMNAYALRGRAARVIGVDFDTRVLQNPLLDEAFVLEGPRMPLPDGIVDVAFSIYVQEHLQDPDAFAREIRRVLKPGGRYFFVTPNRYHYVSLVAALTPSSFHARVNRARGIAASDVFPTFYRLNTRRRVRRVFRAAGLDVVRLDMIECQPNYLLFNRAAFMVGLMYERLVNASSVFAGLRVNLVGECRSPVTLPAERLVR